MAAFWLLVPCALSAQVDTATVIVYDLDSLAVTYTPACNPEACRARPGTVIDFDVVDVIDSRTGEDVTEHAVIRWRVIDGAGAVDLDSISGEATVHNGRRFRVRPFVIDIAESMAIFATSLDSDRGVWTYAGAHDIDAGPIQLSAVAPRWMCDALVVGGVCHETVRYCAYGLSPLGVVVFRSEDYLVRIGSDDTKEVVGAGAACPLGLAGSAALRTVPVTWAVS